MLALIERNTTRANGEAFAWLKSKLGIDLALDARKPTAFYPCSDECGTVLFEVMRFEPKHFRQRRPDGRGGWFWNLDQVRRMPCDCRAYSALIARSR